MAKLKTILETLDDVPENLHEFYVEKDGKFVLDLDGTDSHPDVAALKNALERQKTERRKVADELTKLKDRLAKIPEDFDADAYATAMAELEELRTNPNRKPDEKERQELAAARKTLEQKIANMEKAHAEAITKKDVEIKKRDDKIKSVLIDDGLTKALVEAGVSKEYMKAAKALLRQDCDVIEDEGDYKAIVKSDMGEMEIGKYVSDWVASDEGKVFVPPAKGSDSSNNNSNKTRIITGEKNPWSKEHWNLTLQGKILREDRTKAEKLAKAAGKTIPNAA